MLIRSSLLWLTRDQVFLFDVQRGTSGYCMREYKHTYCSGKSYSASSSVQSQPRVSIARAFPAFVHARYGFAHTRTPRVLHFSAFILICVYYVEYIKAVHNAYSFLDTNQLEIRSNNRLEVKKTLKMCSCI